MGELKAKEQFELIQGASSGSVSLQGVPALLIELLQWVNGGLVVFEYKFLPAGKIEQKGSCWVIADHFEEGKLLVDAEGTLFDEENKPIGQTLGEFLGKFRNLLIHKKLEWCETAWQSTEE